MTDTRSQHGYRYGYRGGDPSRGYAIPPRLIERFHRWRFRRWYAMLPAYYRDFYPIGNAMSLAFQYAKHQIESAEAMDRLASQSLSRVVSLESTIVELRLALAAARSGWNEDQVDRFMGTWFQRHDLPTSEAAKGGGANV